jgi:serine protease Do
LQGSRAKEPESRQLWAMNAKSGTRNRIRDDFANVVQSDMELESTQTGLPVIDLEGRIVGLVIARAGRISTLILPGNEIAEMLKSEPYKLERRPRSVSERQRR